MTGFVSKMLENLGWNSHRIWSTDWFQHKHEEIERAVAAYERAVRKVDDPGVPISPAQIEESVQDSPLQELSAERNSVFPPIPKRPSIGDYTRAELQTLYEWVTSDGRRRTHDEIADEMFSGLPFARSGSKLEATLRDTIRRCEQGMIRRT